MDIKSLVIPANPKLEKLYGFTLIEVMVVIVIISIMVPMSTVAMRGARHRVRLAASSEKVRIFNDAAFRIRLEGYSSVGTTGNDPEAAYRYYRENGYIDAPVDIEQADLSNVTFEGGCWRAIDDQ